MRLQAKQQKEKRIAHGSLAGAAVILMALLVLFDEVGSRAGRAFRRFCVVIVGFLAQYLTHWYYQRIAASHSKVAQTEGLVPRHAAHGTPERQALC